MILIQELTKRKCPKCFVSDNDKKNGEMLGVVVAYFFEGRKERFFCYNCLVKFLRELKGEIGADILKSTANHIAEVVGSKATAK